MRITVLGIGLMGAPMVRRLAGAGHELHIWNRSPAPADALSDIAMVHRTSAAALRGAQVVISMLLDGPVTRAVLLDQGCIAALEPGATLIDMASVAPETDRALAAEAHAHGAHFLDAPVSGGVVGARDGTLSIFVGGDSTHLEAIAPVFAPLGRASLVGPIGAGQMVKLANQLIVGSTIAAVAEGLKLAQTAGCDLAAVRAALAGGFADSRVLDLHGARMVTGDFTPGARSAVQLKDLDNAHDAAHALGLSLPTSDVVRAAFRDLVEVKGGADLDHAAYFKWLDEGAD